MRKLAFVSFFLLIALVAWISRASAASCVKLNENKDNLRKDDSRAVKALVEGELEDLGKEVVEPPCEEEFTIFNIKLGKSYIAHISGPSGSKKQKASTIEELTDVYSQLTRSLIVDKTGESATTRRNVTEQQQNPERIQSENIFYLELGYGLIFGDKISPGPSFGPGLQFELDWAALDISILNFLIANDGSGSIQAEWLSLGLNHFFDKYSDSSLYLGGGLSLATISPELEFGDGNYTNATHTGMFGYANLGYQFLRTSTIRFGVELFGKFPLRPTEKEGVSTGLNSQKDLTGYTPVAGLAITGGF